MGRIEMKRWFLAGSSMTLGLLLSGCGGGGVGSTPPPPTYTKLADLQGNQTFQSAGMHFKSIIGDQFTDHSVQKYGAGVTIAYNAAADSYTLTAPDGTTDTFSSSTSTPPSGYSPQPHQLALFKNDAVLGIETPLVNGVALNYTALASWSHFNVNESSYYNAILGVPTIASDMPRSGTANYQTNVIGSAFLNSSSYDLSAASTATFSADFAAGTVATTLRLAGTPFTPTPMSAARPPVDFSSYSGTGTIAAGGPAFSGTLAHTPDNPIPLTGEFAGAFFGPQAKEMGYSFYLFSGGGLSIQGAVVGTK